MDKRNRRQAEAGEFNHGWSWVDIGEKERKGKENGNNH
jgi:hypothetical protein